MVLIDDRLYGTRRFTFRALLKFSVNLPGAAVAHRITNTDVFYAFYARFLLRYTTR